MRRLLAVVALAGALALPARALAGEGDVVPIMKDKPAPFSGLLVPEARFTQLLEAEIKVSELEARLKAEQRFGISLEDMYKSKLAEATKPLAWYETASFHHWLGFTIGVAVATVAIYGGSRLVVASGNGH